MCVTYCAAYIGHALVSAAKAAKRAEQKAKRAAKEAAKAEKKGSAGGADDTSDQDNPTNGAAADGGLSHSVSQISLSKSDNQPWDEEHGRSTTGVLASHPQSRDIQIDSFTLLFHGHELLADTRLELNYGRRYGLLGLNGCGKSCMLQVRSNQQHAARLR
jgi:ATP-binding cassette subfamily F protein 2